MKMILLLISTIALISWSLQLQITTTYKWITSCKWTWSSSSSVSSLWSVWGELLGAGSRSLPPNYLKVEPARWITNYNHKLQIMNYRKLQNTNKKHHIKMSIVNTRALIPEIPFPFPLVTTSSTWMVLMPTLVGKEWVSKYRTSKHK